MAILAVLLVGLLVPVPVAAGAPKASFDKEAHDYGKVPAGNTVHEEFVLTNRGDGPLIIKELRSSCGCTKAIHGSKEIPPNGQTKIVASFDTTGMRAGRKARAIYVDTNDPKRPTVTLTLAADIVRDLLVEPESLARELPAYTERVLFPIRVSNASTTAYRITGVKTASHGIEPMLEPGTLTVAAHSTGEAAVEMKLDRNPPRFFYSGSITLTTDHPSEPELKLHFLVTLQSGR
jgi:hypothetical protein